jgi:beta-N-acetylhexosaminidase
MRRSSVALAVVATLAGCATQSPVSATIPVSVSTTAPLTTAQRRWVDRTLASLTLRERVGQMVTVWTLGDYTSSGDSVYAQLLQWVERDGVGGVTMSLGTPIEVAAKLNELQRRAKVPLLVSADLEPALGRLESGLFTHYLLETGGATPFPPAMAIAATQRDSDAYDVARIIAREGRAAGIHVNFAPVVDVNNNPSNPVINTRSFGEDPDRVARLSALFVQGALAGGQLPTAKHFPGHGDTDVDSHVGLPVVQADIARLSRLELVPFRAAIQAGAAMVMTAHIALPAIESGNVPATLSPRVITGLLRDSLGFRGVTITDAMTMEGVGKGYTNEESSVLAVKAGADILLKPSDPTVSIDAVVKAVEAGEIPRARTTRPRGTSSSSRRDPASRPARRCHCRRCVRKSEPRRIEPSPRGSRAAPSRCCGTAIPWCRSGRRAARSSFNTCPRPSSGPDGNSPPPCARPVPRRSSGRRAR